MLLAKLINKLMQKQYVQELEEQIRIRDRIKNEEEVKRDEKFKAYEPEVPIMKQNPEIVQSPTREINQEV